MLLPLLAESCAYGDIICWRVGIDSGQNMEMQGEGGPAAAKDGTPGNLFIEVAVAPDPVLTRRGVHIHVAVDVDFSDAILGGDAK